LSNFRKRRAKTYRRSQLEDKVEADLKARGIAYEYETVELAYVKLLCPHCDTVVSKGTYTPDFIVPRKKGMRRLILESKGFFEASDREKHKKVRDYNPNEDIRFLFQRDQKISKSSKTMYSDWCIKHGFHFAFGPSVPQEWIDNDLPPIKKEKERGTRTRKIRC
jgi:hypothetical protein